MRAAPHAPGAKPPVTQPLARENGPAENQVSPTPDPGQGDGHQSSENTGLEKVGGSCHRAWPRPAHLPGAPHLPGPAADSKQNRCRERGPGRVTEWGRAETLSSVRQQQPVQHPTYLFRSQMISGLGLPSALQVKNTVFPEVTSASWGSDVIRGLSVPTRNGTFWVSDEEETRTPSRPSMSRANQRFPLCLSHKHTHKGGQRASPWRDHFTGRVFMPRLLESEGPRGAPGPVRGASSTRSCFQGGRSRKSPLCSQSSPEQAAVPGRQGSRKGAMHNQAGDVIGGVAYGWKWGPPTALGHCPCRR